MSDVAQLQGQNGFVTVEAGQSVTAADSASGAGFRAIVIEEDGTTITAITGSSIVTTPAFFTRTRSQGYVIYGSITGFTVGVGAALGYNK